MQFFDMGISAFCPLWEKQDVFENRNELLSERKQAVAKLCPLGGRVWKKIKKCNNEQFLSAHA